MTTDPTPGTAATSDATGLREAVEAAANEYIASDWLAAHDADVARTAAKEAGERIAQAIEAMHSDAPCSLSFGVAQKRAATIAREEG